MSRFEYTARNQSGNHLKGTIDGINESGVALELIRNGLTPIFIGPYVEKKKPISNLMAFLNLETPSAEELTFMCRQMHSLLKAGVPIVRAVKVVLQSSKNYKLKIALIDILAHLEEGHALSLAMRRHMTVFPELMIVLVTVGENTGSLETVFYQIGMHFQREANTKKQIKSAMRYPIVVLSVLVIAVATINILVIPAFARFFSNFKSELPLPTRLLISSSNFFVHYWFLLLLISGIGLLGLILYLKTPTGRRVLDKWKLAIPLIGSILKRAAMARFSRSFALSIRTGVPLLEGILMISKTTDNTYVSDKILAMRTYIEHGESLIASAVKSELFTPLILQMLAIGEETGEIDRLLDEVSDYYEAEIDYDVKKLSDSIEPILIILIGVMVMILALGVFLPMWDLWKVTAGK